MGNRGLVAFVSLILMASCSAFDNGSVKLDEYTASGKPNVVVGGSGEIYQGFYQGTKTLESNTCQKITGAVGASEAVMIDILQSGDVLSLQFSDGAVSNGTLKGNQLTMIVKSVGVTEVYELEFSEEDATGTLGVVENGVEGKLDQTCATYKVKLEKGASKPEGFGEAALSGMPE